MNRRQRGEKNVTLTLWRKRISAVFVMAASPEDAMQREKGLLPVEHREGSIMNEKVLAQMLNTTRETSKSLKDEFRIFEIDTSAERKRSTKQITEAVANLALNVIEEHLREDILSLRKYGRWKSFVNYWQRITNFRPGSFDRSSFTPAMPSGAAGHSVRACAAVY
jgi:hypothetical protein